MNDAMLKKMIAQNERLFDRMTKLEGAIEKAQQLQQNLEKMQLDISEKFDEMGALKRHIDDIYDKIVNYRKRGKKKEKEQKHG